MPRQSRKLSALGGVFLVIALGQSTWRVLNGHLLEAALEFVLIGFSGLLILYVARWVTTSEIDADLHPRIVLWCLAGIGVMLVFLFIRWLHPGIGNPFSHATRVIALAISSIAGLGIGVHDARALTRERELERRNDELRKIQTDLEAALREVKTSNERLEQFATVASHDLREPIRMVTSYLELLEQRYGDELDDDATEFIAYAVDGADRMRTMVESLLAYSRVETQGKPLEPVALDAVLDDVVTDLQFQIEEHDAVIEIGPLPRVRGDRDQLRQLLQNLLSNAVEYSDDPPQISVTAEMNGAECVISVRDEGIGIDPEDQEQIFELFQRLHAVGEREGSGVGLALCRRIIERHDGTIWVDSEPGKGSTFSFTLPKIS